MLLRAKPEAAAYYLSLPPCFPLPHGRGLSTCLLYMNPARVFSVGSVGCSPASLFPFPVLGAIKTLQGFTRKSGSKDRFRCQHPGEAGLVCASPGEEQARQSGKDGSGYDFHPRASGLRL